MKQWYKLDSVINKCFWVTWLWPLLDEDQMTLSVQTILPYLLFSSAFFTSRPLMSQWQSHTGAVQQWYLPGSNRSRVVQDLPRWLLLWQHLEPCRPLQLLHLPSRSAEKMIFTSKCTLQLCKQQSQGILTPGKNTKKHTCTHRTDTS